MVDVSSRGDARGRPRDAPVALELDERPLVPVHLQQHRVPDPHRGRGLDARERGRRWRAGKSAQFRHARRRIGGGIGTRARGGGGWRSASGTRRGGAVGAVAALPTARGAQRLSHSVALAPSSARQSSGPDTSRFAALFKRRAPPSRPSMSAPRAGTHPRCDPFDLIRDPSARGIAPRSDGRGGGNADGPCQREEEVKVGAVVDPSRPASPTPAAPRPLHRTRRRDSSVARAELLEMEREARALREEDAWVRDTHSTYPNPPRVVHADASRGVHREPARCRVPRYPPPLPRSLEVVPTIFVLEAKARRETEEEVIRGEGGKEGGDGEDD